MNEFVKEIIIIIITIYANVALNSFHESEQIGFVNKEKIAHRNYVFAVIVRYVQIPNSL